MFVFHRMCAQSMVPDIRPEGRVRGVHWPAPPSLTEGNGPGQTDAHEHTDHNHRSSQTGVGQHSTVCSCVPSVSFVFVPECLYSIVSVISWQSSMLCVLHWCTFLCVFQGFHLPCPCSTVSLSAYIFHHV